MGKQKRKNNKLLDMDVDFLVDKLEKGEYTPGGLLGDVLVEFYDVILGVSDRGVREAQAKVIKIMEEIKKKEYIHFQEAYINYFRTYQSICREYRLHEKPDLESNQEPEKNLDSATKHRRLLDVNFVTSIAHIQQGRLEAEEFLRTGLVELIEIAIDIPFQRRRFSAAMSNYEGVIEFLADSGIYNVESYRQDYKYLLRKFSGKFSENSAGIVKRAI